MLAYDDPSLYKSLKELAIITPAQLDQVYELSKRDHTSLANLLIEKDLVSDENLGKVISDLISIPYVNLSKISIPEEILHIIPEVVAVKQRVIAFGRDSNGLKLAMVDPTNTEIKQFIAKKIGENVVVYFATDRDIDQALRFYHSNLQKSFDELLKEQVIEAGTTSGEAPVAKIVDLLINYAYSNRASDIHLEPEKERALVRFRIDGVLHDVLAIPTKLHEQIVSRIKVLSKLRTDEHLSAQDGKLQVKLEQEDLDIRVSVVPIITGEKVVLRLLSSRSRQFSLSDLGMSESDLNKVKEGFGKPYGMVLATGPTGSGKTTTIYAILKIINIRDRNIATIEDPVEYDIEGVNQIQVNPKTNLTFANGLRAILRQDPDAIFVGEIRDEETAGIAVNSATTGHLVLSTVHTSDAATALPRLLDMNIEPYLVASTVNIIIGQRLVRRICEKCRVSQLISVPDLSKHISENLIKKHFGNMNEIRIYRGNGCSVCYFTGYVGRIGIFEVLKVTDAVRDLIMKKATSFEVQTQAIKEGMTSMLEDGLDKVANGITTIEEVLRATKE